MKNSKYGKISSNLEDNIKLIKKLTSGSADLVIREIIISGIKCAAIAAEGMVNSFYYSSIITDNFCSPDLLKAKGSEELYHHIYKYKIISPDQKEFYTIDDLFTFIYSGFGVILIDGVNTGISFGAQGFNFRSVTNPSTDENIKGSKEGFTEALKINQTMIRRRIKAPELVFESIRLGNNSKTDCTLVYMSNIVSKNLLKKVRDRLSNADIDMVLESGSIKMLLTEKPLSLFSEIGSTERPDTVAKKIYEGKIAIIIDGTPFVLIVPFLFAEHFHSLDDFEYKAVFSNFIRFLKYSAFVISILLPGVYVAIATHHPYIFSPDMQEKISDAAQSTPYSFLIEALLIHFAYEIMREAGLRLPKEIGHAVSIVGGLIIGDAAVSAGIVSAPMVIIAALSAISAFIVPALLDSLVIMRFVNIFLGGFLGLYGIALGAALICVNICAKTVFGIPYSSAISPANTRALSSFLYKSPKQQFASAKVPKIYDMPGASMDSESANMKYTTGEKISSVLLSIAAFAAAVLSVWIYTLYLQSVILPNLHPALAPIPLLVLLLLSKNCSTIGSSRTSSLLMFFFASGALILSFGMIFSGLTAKDLAIALFSETSLFAYFFAEIIILVLFLPFCKKEQFKQLGIVILLNILSVLVLLEISTSEFIFLLPFSVLFMTGLEFVKLLYTVNQIDSTVNIWSKSENNTRTVVSVLIFITALVFIITIH